MARQRKRGKSRDADQRDSEMSSLLSDLLEYLNASIDSQAHGDDADQEETVPEDDLEQDDDPYDESEEEPLFQLCDPKAVEILEQADTRFRKGRYRIFEAARRAIDVDPYAVEALVILGDSAATPTEQADFYHRAARAARHHEPRLVAKVMPRIRVYMSDQLDREGQFADAAEILQGALEDDPRDHVLARWRLAGLMLRLGWNDELKAALQPFIDDEVGPVPFARALLSYRSHGETPAAKQLLTRARDLNPFVPPMILGYLDVADENEFYFRPGSEEEASVITKLLRPAWRTTPGAIAWLRECLQVHRTDSTGGPPEDLHELPHSDQIWTLHLLRHARLRTYFLIVADTNGVPWQVDSCGEKRPTPSEAWEFCVNVMMTPSVGPSRRPRTLRIGRKEWRALFLRRCQDLDIEVEVVPLDSDQTVLLRRALEQNVEAPGETLNDFQSVPARLKDGLLTTPMTDDPWIVGLFQPPMWIHDRATPYRVWLMIVVAEQDGILAVKSSVELPDPDTIAESILSAMLQPMIGEPRRPQLCFLDVPDMKLVNADILEEYGVEVAPLNDRRCLDPIVLGLIGHGAPDMPIALAEVEGVTDEHMQSLHEAAVSFYKAAPWLAIPPDQLFEIACPDLFPEPWGGIIIGQLGQDLGLVMYDSVPLITNMLRRDTAPDASRWSTVYLNYSEIFEIPAKDLWYLERRGWPVASPEAYPSIGRVRPGITRVTPTRDELVILELALRYLPSCLEFPPGTTKTVDRFPSLPHLRGIKQLVIRRA